MVRPADQDTIAIEEKVCHSKFPKGRGMPRHAHPTQRHATPRPQAKPDTPVTSRHATPRHAALRHAPMSRHAPTPRPHATPPRHATSLTPRHIPPVTQGSTRVSEDAERGEDMGERLDCGLHRKAGFGLASLNNCGEPWNVGGCR